MLARVYGVEAIVSKDKVDRDELMDIIKQLNADKEELNKSKEELIGYAKNILDFMQKKNVKAVVIVAPRLNRFNFQRTFNSAHFTEGDLCIAHSHPKMKRSRNIPFFEFIQLRGFSIRGHTQLPSIYFQLQSLREQFQCFRWQLRCLRP